MKGKVSFEDETSNDNVVGRQFDSIAKNNMAVTHSSRTFISSVVSVIYLAPHLTKEASDLNPLLREGPGLHYSLYNQIRLNYERPPECATGNRRSGSGPESDTLASKDYKWTIEISRVC